MSDVRVLHGDCVELMRQMPDNSVDAIVTDPPYELGFMGKQWDGAGIAYSLEMWGEALRVLKPGGHLLAFGGTRTYHRMACAIEDAGFEIRDSIHWVYGSGFPKSLDVSKAIDKAAGAEREVVGTKAWSNSANHFVPGENHKERVHLDETAPATEEAARWEGWGTALKPAHEPIVVARKPLAGTVAGNVLVWGTGGLNIDGCRVGTEVRTNNFNDFSNQHGNQFGNGAPIAKLGESQVVGRWPANVVFDRTAGEALDQQSGVSAPKPGRTGTRGGNGFGMFDDAKSASAEGTWPADGGGGASRFFTQADFGPDDWPFVYQAKPSRRERNAGLDGLPEQQIRRHSGGEYAHNSGSTESSKNGGASNNHHPTVKPVALMRHLVRLVTPPGGTVLDPFAGSGTTLVAAILEGFNAVGCEMTDEYLPIIAGRVEWAHERAFLFDELAKAAPQQPTLL
jgi:site-specific DNA-methyltransferase (adenine-specific)